MLAHLATGATAYGVNTGLGYLAGTPIEPAEQRAFQRSILLRGAGQGPPLAPAVVRGAMLIRLAGFLSGRAGGLGGAVPLHRRPAQRRLGAARAVARDHERGRGDRAQPSLPDLRRRGPRRSRTERRWTRPRRSRAVACAPYEPGLKEGIALVNGAPLAPALAAWLAARCARAARPRDAGRSADRRAGGLLAAAVLARGSGGSRAIPGRSACTRSWRSCTAGPPTGATGRRLRSPSASFRRSTARSQTWSTGSGSRSRASCARSPTARSTSAPTATSRRASTRAATSTRRRSASGWTRSRSAFAQVGNLSERRLHRLLDSRFSGLARPAGERPGAPDRNGLRPQVGARVRRREPHARRPGRACTVRQLGRAGGLPGVQLPRRPSSSTACWTTSS